MTTLTIRLDSKLEKTLERVAKSTGRTKSEIAREALGIASPRRLWEILRAGNR